MGIIYDKICVNGGAAISDVVTQWRFGDVAINWMPLAAAAMLASVVVIVLIYLFGVITRDPNANTFAKIELYEVFISFIIVLFLMGVLGSLCSVSIGKLLVVNQQAPLPAGNDDIDEFLDMDVFSAGEDYFEKVSADMEGWMVVNYFFAIWLDEAATITPYSRPLGVGMVAAPLAGLAAPLKQVVYNVYVALSIAYIINYAQLYVFRFSIIAFMFIYFPIGIFLRCFTPTRRIGGTLLGVGIGFLVIVPLLTLVAHVMFMSSYGVITLLNDSITNYVGSSLSVTAGAKSILANLFDISVPTIIGSFVAGKFGAMLGFIIGAGGIPGSLLTAAFIIPISTVGAAFLIGFLIPAFNTIILVYSVKSLSRSLGEEIDVSSLTRLI
ncbi:MAG: hypothetical protein ABII22_02610 [Candidatus Micrarchaeota archaeon]